VSAPLVSEPKAYSEGEALRNHRRANFCCIFWGNPSIFESNDCKRAKHSFWSGNLVAASCRKGGALHGYHAIAPCRIKPHKSYNSMAQQIVVRAATNTLRTQSTNMALPLYITAGHKQTLHSVPHIRNPEWFSQAKSMSNTNPNAVFKMGQRSNRLTQIKFCKV
jgi:hypothetical protein